MTCTLIAEDNACTAAFLNRVLKKYGHTVKIVNNAVDAWRILDGGDFDVVLANVSMPGLDSLSLAKKALWSNPAAHIVLITGFAASAVSLSGKPARPFHLRDIGRRVNALWRDEAPAAASEQKNGTVVYPDFATRGRARRTDRSHTVR